MKKLQSCSSVLTSKNDLRLIAAACKNTNFDSIIIYFCIVIACILLASMLFVTISPATASAAEAETPKVRVGWFTYPGNSEVRDGKYYGYSYDYLVEIAKYTGWEYEFVQKDFDTCNEMLASGDLDIVCGLQKAAEREAVFDFPDVAFGETYSVLFTNKDSNLQPYEYTQFEGIRVGVLNDTLNAQYFEQFAINNGFSCTIVKYNSIDTLSAAVEAGDTIDAAVLSSYVATDKTRIIASFAPQPIYIVTTKGNHDVCVGLNRALNYIKTNNAYFSYSLYQKYYVTKESPNLTENELAIVRASQDNPILIGVVDSSAPVCYLNEETGEYEGITVDILNIISERTGLKIRYVSADLSRRDAATSPTQDSPMLVLGATKSDLFPNTLGWHLSDGLLSDSLAVVGIRDKNLFGEKTEKKVAVMTGFDMTSTYAATYMSDFTIVEYATLQECMDAVAEGEADAAIYLQSCIRYLLQKPYYEKLDIIPTYSVNLDVCIAGFTDASKDYVNIINKGLQKVTEDESRSIVLNYTVGHPYELTLGDTLYKYRIPLIVIACLVVFVIALLTALYVTRRKSNKQIMDALAIATQASAAKGNFMSRMSHEIRTPLNAVIGYNTIARNELTEAKTEAEHKQSEMKVMDCLTKSDIASRHLLNIINDVLNISAIESGKIKVVNERFDFKGLISSLTAIFYSQAKSKGVNFEVQFDTHTDEWIIGDQIRVNQILTNLLSNAVKFTPDGGDVTLFVRPVTEQSEIKLHFEVHDTGIGMTAENLERIWTPFEQADASISRRFGGTGLGLSITKTLVELLGGSISVTSQPGVGTTFSVDLSFERTEQPQLNSVYDFSSINALIVDDDISTCDYIRLLLTRSGVRSAAVTSGEEAITAVKAALDENIPYTICLIDWRMPKMDGLETIRHIRNIVGDALPIIVITAYDYTEIADKAAAVGVNKFISKPLFQSSLFNLLANISGCPTPKLDEKPSAHDFSDAKVLLAEDNTMNMEIARKLLKSAKINVDAAWNGQEAVDKFLSAPAGTYKAILMDVQMPVMDGYQATRTIRSSQHPEATTIPIIAMTADAFAENIAESHAAGMDDHISKPIDLPTLFNTLHRHLG